MKPGSTRQGKEPTDMMVLSLLQVLAQSTVEDDASTEVPWLTVILVMAVAFGVAAVVIGRLRKKAAEIE